MMKFILFIFFSINVTEDLTITLEIRETKVTDAGNYVIEISNEHGSETAEAELTIDFLAPKFTSGLRDVHVTLGDNANLECAYDGLPEPDIKWLVSGLSVEDSDKYRIATDKRRKRTCLELTQMTLDDAEMTYACRATNVVGEAVTSATLHPQGLYPRTRTHLLSASTRCV